VRLDRIVIDIDATLVNAHAEKEGAAVNYRSRFGFHLMLAYLDETHEALAGVLRGGGAPAHSAQAVLRVLLVVLSIAGGVMCFRVGDLGAKAVWHDRIHAGEASQRTR
jgi:Transposase DDE domain group 1